MPRMVQGSSWEVQRESRNALGGTAAGQPKASGHTFHMMDVLTHSGDRD